MSDKYIIKNCPNLTTSHYGTGETIHNQCGLTDDDLCANCTDCKLKQIVELCKRTCRMRCTNNCLGTKKHCGYGQILKLLDIQEIE